MPQYVQVGRDTVEFPDGMADADIAKAINGQQSAPQTKPLDTTGRLKAALVKEPAAGTNTLFGETDMPGRVVRAVGDMFLPGTNAQAGAMAGTLAAGPLAPLARVGPVLGRILGATAGGGVGGAVEDGASGALEGAARGGAAATVGEGLGKAASVVTRSLPGAKGAIAAQDAERAAGAVGGMSPGLAPGATVADLRRAAVEAPQRLGAAKQAAVQDVERALAGGQPGNYVPPGEIPMPSLAYRETVGRSPASPMRAVTQPTLEGAGTRIGSERPITRGVYGEETVGLPTAASAPGHVVQRPTGERAFTGEGTQIAADIPVAIGKTTWTLRDANAELSRIGDMLRGRTPLDPRYKDADLSRLYGQVARDIERGIEQVGGPEAAAAWRNAQMEYKAGRAAIKPFQTGAAYRPGATADEMQLNTPYLQRWLASPKNEAYLRSKLLPEQFSALETALTRGGGAGSADVLAPGRGGALDALMEILRGKGGATQIPALAPRTLLPGLASQHAGRAPYPMPPALQTILDLAAERGSDITSSGR